MAKRRHAGVILIAENAHGDLVETKEIAFDTYYGSGDALVDSSDYRASRGIRRLKGEVYAARGALEQVFDNRYDANGQYLGGRCVHADGTIIED